MKIETKFAIGQKVYIISPYQHEQTSFTCPVCKGNKFLTITETNSKIRCTECYGNGQRHTYVRKYNASKEASIIAMIKISKAKRKLIVSYDTTTPKGYGYANDIDESDLFETLEATQAECDRRNQAEAAKAAQEEKA